MGWSVDKALLHKYVCLEVGLQKDTHTERERGRKKFYRRREIQNSQPTPNKTHERRKKSQDKETIESNPVLRAVAQLLLHGLHSER